MANSEDQKLLDSVAAMSREHTEKQCKEDERKALKVVIQTGKHEIEFMLFEEKLWEIDYKNRILWFNLRVPREYIPQHPKTKVRFEVLTNWEPGTLISGGYPRFNIFSAEGKWKQTYHVFIPEDKEDMAEGHRSCIDYS